MIMAYIFTQKKVERGGGGGGKTTNGPYFQYAMLTFCLVSQLFPNMLLPLVYTVFFFTPDCPICVFKNTPISINLHLISNTFKSALCWFLIIAYNSVSNLQIMINCSLFAKLKIHQQLL